MGFGVVPYIILKKNILFSSKYRKKSTKADSNPFRNVWLPIRWDAKMLRSSQIIINCNKVGLRPLVFVIIRYSKERV